VRRILRPFIEGFLRLMSRRLLPTALASRDIALRLDAQLKRDAVFSARVENARVLQRIRDVVARVVRGATPESQASRDAGTAPLVLSPADAKLQILRQLQATGYQPDPRDIGTIKDLTSDKRLDLIVETNEATQHGQGRWVASQDPDTLDAFPAWELVRISPALEPRDWRTRWMIAGGQTFGGRMIALKNAPVWEGLGSSRLFADALDNPFPPFAFNSGMDVRDVSRRECEALGVIRPGQAAPAPNPQAARNAAQVDAEAFDADMQAALARDPDLVLDGGVLRSREP
jgi:hypothetical protein